MAYSSEISSLDPYRFCQVNAELRRLVEHCVAYLPLKDLGGRPITLATQLKEITFPHEIINGPIKTQSLTRFLHLAQNLHAKTVGDLVSKTLEDLNQVEPRPGKKSYAIAALIITDLKRNNETLKEQLPTDYQYDVQPGIARFASNGARDHNNQPVRTNSITQEVTVTRKTAANDSLWVKFTLNTNLNGTLSLRGFEIKAPEGKTYALLIDTSSVSVSPDLYNARVQPSEDSRKPPQTQFPVPGSLWIQGRRNETGLQIAESCMNTFGVRGNYDALQQAIPALKANSTAISASVA